MLRIVQKSEVKVKDESTCLHESKLSCCEKENLAP